MAQPVAFRIGVGPVEEESLRPEWVTVVDHCDGRVGKPVGAVNRGHLVEK
jgi:hypothetical protein